MPAGETGAPGPVAVRWFGRSGSARADYVRRRVSGWSAGEPAHVGYVERPALLDALRDEIERHRPDVVHAFGWGSAGVWRYVDGVPVVHMAVDAWHLNASNRLLPSWRRITDAGERQRIVEHEQRHYPHDAAVVVVAEPDAASIRHLVPAARVEVVPNGVDAGPAPTPLPDAPVLGFHGSFDAAHNVDAARALVEEVLPRVRAAIPETRVLLIGRRPNDVVRRLSGPAVELRADVADARAELRDVTVYVAPLVSGSGLKNKVLEAMAAGRPVVTTSLGAAGIGAGDGVTVAESADALAAAAVELLADRQRCADVGTAGRRRVEREFTWARSAERIEAIWQDVR